MKLNYYFIFFPQHWLFVTQSFQKWGPMEKPFIMLQVLMKKLLLKELLNLDLHSLVENQILFKVNTTTKNSWNQITTMNFIVVLPNFWNSNLFSVQLKNGDTVEYEVLDIIEFTSARKRMSCVVRFPDGNIKLLIKGMYTYCFWRHSSTTWTRFWVFLSPSLSWYQFHEKNIIFLKVLIWWLMNDLVNLNTMWNIWMPQITI